MKMNLIFSRSGVALALGLLSQPMHSQTAEPVRPNVILIMTDDLGTGWFPFHAKRLKVGDLEREVTDLYASNRGNAGKIDPARHIEAAKTSMPFLDKLAREGVWFENGFATASLCAPSRAGLLTGTFQQQWGAYWNRDLDDHGLPANRVVLAESLKTVGYATAMIGKWHLAKKDPSIPKRIWTQDMGETLPIPKGLNGRKTEFMKLLGEAGHDTSSMPGQHPLDRGFDYYYGFNNHDSDYFEAADLWENRSLVPKRPADEFLTELLSEKATRFIESAMERKAPFFLYYAPLTLHGPIVPPPQKYSSKFDIGHRYSNEYAGHLLGLDEGIRQLFAALEARGQLDNTLFFFTSDNGCTLYNVPPHNAPNRGGKGSGWFGGLNVPLVVWGKNVKTRGPSREIISLADLMPTILDYAGMEAPKDLGGRSHAAYLSGKAAKGPRASLSSVGIHSTRWSHFFHEGMAENNKHDAEQAPLYAWHFDGRHVFMRITPTRPGLYANLSAGLPDQVLLFDTDKDRQQRHNLAASQWDKVERMDSDLRDWLATLAEPVSSQKQEFKSLLEPVREPRG